MRGIFKCVAVTEESGITTFEVTPVNSQEKNFVQNGKLPLSIPTDQLPEENFFQAEKEYFLNFERVN